MTSNRGNEGAGSQPPDAALGRVARLMLYFTTPRRKAAAVLVAVAGWVPASLLEDLAENHLRFVSISTPYTYAAGFALAVLFTQGGILRRPVRLPVEVMRRTASGRFAREESWTSSHSVPDALGTLRGVFSRPQAPVRSIGTTVWAELGKDWTGDGMRHREAAIHLKRRPPVHFFVEDRGGRTTVTAFSGDLRLTGMWDVLKLSDEMTDAAVRAARDATSDERDALQD